MNQECSICLDNLDNNQKKLKYCNHVFHEDCINEWTHTHNTCPVCREPIKKVMLCKIESHKKFCNGLILVKDDFFAFKTIGNIKQKRIISVKFNLINLKSVKYNSRLKILFLKVCLSDKLKIFKIKFNSRIEMHKCVYLFIHHINKLVTDDLKISV